MKTRLARAPACGVTMALLAQSAAVAGLAQSPADARTFEFTYQFTVDPPPEGTLRVWVPIATSDLNQSVDLQAVSSPVETRIGRDSQYGNQILYAEIKNVKVPIAFALTYEVTRKEYSRGNLNDLMRYNGNGGPPPQSLVRFLEPDRLVPSNDRFRSMAEEITRGKRSDIEKAYAIYDYVFHTLRYDKSGEGWGRGDAMWACDTKHGNCTDFHSLFIALMRAEKIPARFEIGFPLPESVRQGEIPGYHCWAEFYVSGPGWVPVDISEAWKNPAKHDFFFGSLDTNRVQFTVGRDLALNPAQAGPPINYFVYPYAELNGKPYERLGKKFSFHDLPSSADAEGLEKNHGK